MKFFNVITKSKQFEIDEIVMNMSSAEVGIIESLYKSTLMVEYTNDLGNESMFLITDSVYLSKLEELYNRYSIEFKVIDLTKKVLFDYSFKINYRNEYKATVEKEIIELIKKYKTDWTTKDDVLDKILERGIDSLTDFDLDVLNN